MSGSVMQLETGKIFLIILLRPLTKLEMYPIRVILSLPQLRNLFWGLSFLVVVIESRGWRTLGKLYHRSTYPSELFTFLWTQYKMIIAKWSLKFKWLKICIVEFIYPLQNFTGETWYRKLACCVVISHSEHGSEDNVK
jgi:hypothetical protein